MPTGDLLRFASIDELLHGVGFGGVQQAIACRGAFRPRRNQRLGDELPERIDDLIGRLARSSPATAIAPCSVNGPAKMARRRSATRSLSSIRP